MFRGLLAGAVVMFASPALGQEPAARTEATLPNPIDSSDSLSIALGAGYVPDYEGSNDYRVIPAAVVRGRVSGISFSTRGTYLYVDVVPRGAGKLSFDAGPIAGVRLNRTGKIRDDLVKLLPDRKTAIELGGFAGLTYRGLTYPYDSLGVRLDVVKDVGGAHKSTIVSPTVDFSTPLSRRTYVSLAASADWVGGGYADYYFSISPADSLASGLPVYNAKGGFKNWRLLLIANQSLTGDLTHGISLFGITSYSHLSGDFERSPIVAQRGSAGQWLAALGLAYTF